MCQSPDKDTTVHTMRNQAGWSRREFRLPRFLRAFAFRLNATGAPSRNSNVEETTPEITPRSQHRLKVRVMATLTMAGGRSVARKDDRCQVRHARCETLVVVVTSKNSSSDPRTRFDSRLGITSQRHRSERPRYWMLVQLSGLERQSGDSLWPDRTEPAGQRCLMPEPSLRCG